jgi:hypothetical protein
LPAILRGGADGKGREERLLAEARRFAESIQDTEDLPDPYAIRVQPFLPNPGGQGRTTPPYQAAFDLWRFCYYNMRLWEEAVGVHWSAPARGRTAQIKDWVREFGGRKGSDALQQFVDLGRACGVLRASGERTSDEVYPGYAPVVNRLMWELLPGTIVDPEKAATVARRIRDEFEQGFGQGGVSIAIAENWRACIRWRYIPSLAPPRDGQHGRFVAEEDRKVAEVACPLPTLLGAPPGAPRQRPLNQDEGLWWQRLASRAEHVLDLKPDWKAGFLLPVPASLPIRLALPAVRRERDVQATLAELAVGISKYDVDAVAVAVVVPRWDVPGRAIEGPPHRAELWAISPQRVERWTCDMKTIAGRAVPQRWLPVPPNASDEIDVEGIRRIVGMLGSPESRGEVVDSIGVPVSSPTGPGLPERGR